MLQLMRAYTLSLLAQLSPDGKPVSENEIITWANNRSVTKQIIILTLFTHMMVVIQAV